MGWGHLRANGQPRGGPWRQLLCIVCRSAFLEPLGTLLHGKHAAVDLIVRGIACLAEGLGLRGPARGFEVAPNTVRLWLVEAAEPLQALSRHVLHDVRVRQGQLAALCALLSAVTAREGREAAASARLARAPQWRWGARAPASKLLLAIDVGERPLALAQRVVHQGVQGLAPDYAPRLLTDGLREYLSAFLPHYGHWGQPPRRQAKGPSPKPRGMPRPQWLYAQGVKTLRRRRLVRVSHRVVFGTLAAVPQVFAVCGWQINTACVERLNLSMRQPVAAIGRRVSTLCKDEEGVRQPCALYQTY